MILAYVFWHWRGSIVNRSTYEEHLIAFHQSLFDDPPKDFLGSSIFRSSKLPWGKVRGEVYQDWYLIKGFEALGWLNEGAVSGSHKIPHDLIATKNKGGTGGLYRLLKGSPDFAESQKIFWFSKPRGEGYGEFTQQLDDLMVHGNQNLWKRQMALGPAPEFCLLSSPKVALPSKLNPVEIPIVKIWERFRF